MLPFNAVFNAVFARFSRPRVTTMQALIGLSIALQLVVMSSVVTYFTLQHQSLVLRDLAQSHTTQALATLQDHLEQQPVHSTADMTDLLPHRSEGRLWILDPRTVVKDQIENSTIPNLPIPQSLISQSLTPQSQSSHALTSHFRSALSPLSPLLSSVGQVQTVEWQDQKIYLRILPWQDSTGKTWYLMSMVFEQDLKNTISHHDRITFGLAGLGFVSAIALTLLCARQLVARVRRAFSRLEKLQQQSDERLQRLIINVPGVIYRAVRDDDGLDRFTYISSRCYEMYEVPAEDVLKDSQVLWQLVEPDDLDAMKMLANRSLENLTPWRMEYRIRTNSGQLKWLQVSASPDLRKDGSVAWDGVILDITDRRRADEILNRYRATLEEKVKKRTAELEKANQELALMAKLDGLTQLANRRYFDQHLSNDWKRLARSQQPLSLIMCDVDYFKRFNDCYGHQEGDRVLQEIAKVLKQVTKRPDDLPARYGGEEFAIVLPNTDLIGAMQVAEKLRQDVVALQINHARSSVSGFVTLSLGIATVTPNEIAETVRSPEDLIRIADLALYQAKHNGRNQSHVQDSRCLRPASNTSL